MAITQALLEDINLGLPVPRGSKLRFIKKIVARLTWPFLAHQVKLNNLLVADISKLSQNDTELKNTLTAITETLGQIQFSLTHHTSVLERFEQTLTRHDGFIHHNEQVLAHHLEVLERHDSVLERHEKSLQSHDATLIHHDEVCTRQDITLEDHEKYISEIAEISNSFGRLSTLIELVQQQSFTRLYEVLGPIQETINNHARQLQDQDRLFETKFTDTSSYIEEIESRISKELSDTKYSLAKELSDTKYSLAKELSDTKYSLSKEVKSVWPRLAQVDLFLNEVKKSFPAPPKAESLAALPSSFEGLYSALEDTFRGSEANIKLLLSDYIPILKEISHLGPVVDIGCGRGEFLELLQEEKIASYGVDTLEDNIDKCLKKGLEAQLEDAISHLRSVRPGSLGAVTAIHIIEHLSLETQIELIDRSLVALAPGGILIIETPNPENIIIGSCNFYLDPTHIKPLPPRLLEFLVSARGFIGVDIIRHDRDGYLYLDGIQSILEGQNVDPKLTLLAKELHNMFISAPDYSIIGKKIA